MGGAWSHCWFWTVGPAGGSGPSFQLRPAERTAQPGHWISAANLATHHRIGGSFQMRQAADLIDAYQTVPSIDGLHIVQTLSRNQTFACCFRHASGETAVLPAEEALEDDWAMALAEASARMIIE